MALNGLISRGVPEDWATHGIGHELTAFYGIDHGRSLAVVMPALWKNQFEKKKAKLAQYGHRVWGILARPGQGKDEIAVLAIEKTVEFFESLGVPTKLSGYGVNAVEAAEKISKRFENRGLTSKHGIGENGCIGPKEIKDILEAC
jgi:NADP-dependent alcohol dehydrogenase